MTTLLTQLLYELDNDKEVKNNHEIWMKIHPVSCVESSFECDAEKLAFYISENKGMHIKSEWDFFYPETSTNKNNHFIEYPQLQEITTECINYWRKRSNETNNLFMKVRYTGLVLVFDKIVNNKFDFNLLNIYIDLLFEISKSNTESVHELEKYALRALNLSKKFNVREKIDKSIENLIALEERVFDYSNLSSWGFCFEKLILGKELNLTRTQKEGIISSFIKKYNLYSEDINPPYLLKPFLDFILTYHRSIGDVNGISNFLLKYHDKLIEYTNTIRPIVAVAELKGLYHLLIENNMHQKAGEILVLINSYLISVSDDLIVYETAHQIPNEKMKKMIDENTIGDFEPTLLRLILKNVISKRNVLNERAKRLAQFPLMGVFGSTYIDSNGRPTAKIENDDEEGIAFAEMRNTISLNSSFFDLYLREIITKNNKSSQDIVDYIHMSPLFIPENKEILLKGVDAFLKEDHITSVHLLVPQIESAFRKAVELSGGSILRENGFDGFNYQTLDGLIKNDNVKVMFNNGSEIIFYFRSVLSESRGLNIRNNICHGILRAEDINFTYSLLVIHVILLLAQVKLK